MVGDNDLLSEESGITSVAISVDGTMVVAGSLDKMVRIWDIHSGKLLEKLKGHEDSVYSVAFTPDGKGVISGSLDQTLKFWDVSAVAQRAKTTGSQPSTPTANGDASEKQSISASLTCMGHRVRIDSFHIFSITDGLQDFVLSTKFTTDSRWIVSGSKDRTVYFWDARTAELQFMLQGHKNSGTSVSDSLKGLGATLRRVVWITNPPFPPVISLDIHPFGGMMATGSGDSTTRLCMSLVHSSCPWLTKFPQGPILPCRYLSPCPSAGAHREAPGEPLPRSLPSASSCRTAYSPCSSRCFRC